MFNNKKNQLVPNKECYSRMNFLYQASMIMAGRNDVLSAYYGELCKGIGKKAVLHMEPAMKRNLCKRCSLAQIPVKTANLAVEQPFESKRKKRRMKKVEVPNVDQNVQMSIECSKCGFKRNFRVNPDYDLWLENPNAVAEEISLRTDKKKETENQITLKN